MNCKTLSLGTQNHSQKKKKLALCHCSFDKQNPIYQLARQLQPHFDNDAYYQKQDSE